MLSLPRFRARSAGLQPGILKHAGLKTGSTSLPVLVRG
jgi:hypothetical protein